MPRPHQHRNNSQQASFPPIIRKQVYTRQTALEILNISEKEAQAPQVLYISRLLVRELRPRDPVSEANAALWFVRQKIRYQNDPDGIEVVFGPMEMLRMIEDFGKFSEDCESQAALVYSLLRSIGHVVRFALYNFTGSDKIDHMNVETRISDVWYMLDPILTPDLVEKMIPLIVWKETLSLTQWR